MNNPGFLTDFQLLGSKSRITEFESLMVIKTLDNPTFMNGNCLLLKNPPTNKNKGDIENLFLQNFDKSVLRSHVSIAWECAHGNLANFIADGYEYNHNSVLTIKPKDFIKPLKTNSKITVKQFNESIHWQQWIQNEVDERPETITKSNFEVFIEKPADFYRELSEKGIGGFFGAFIENRLVGSVGLYIFDGIGRFQQVSTLKEYRRNYICNTLLEFIISKKKQRWI
jgi:hypothetical protein